MECHGNGEKDAKMGFLFFNFFIFCFLFCVGLFVCLFYFIIILLFVVGWGGVRRIREGKGDRGCV